jgi:hypothetical protein
MDLSAKAAHEGALLLSEAFRDEEDDAIAAVDANESESYSRVAGGGLGDDGVLVEEAVAFGIEDHAQRGAIFDGAAGVEELELGKEGSGAGAGETAQFEDGSVADEGSDVGGGARGGNGAGWRHKDRTAYQRRGKARETTDKGEGAGYRIRAIGASQESASDGRDRDLAVEFSQKSQARQSAFVSG